MYGAAACFAVFSGLKGRFIRRNERRCRMFCRILIQFYLNNAADLILWQDIGAFADQRTVDRN